MNCAVCNKKVDVGDLLKCNGCKAVYHYRCLNITKTSFMDGQMKRSFKCDSCTNITQRLRVTDDTPVRGARVGVQHQLLDSGTLCPSAEAGQTSLTPQESYSIKGIMEQVHEVIMAKLSTLEIKILEELKSTVTVLALENSKLRTELQEANQKCTNYEQEIKVLKLDRKNRKDSVIPVNVSADRQRQSYAVVTSPSTSSAVDGAVRAPAPAAASQHSSSPAPAVSYASVARKQAVSNVGSHSDWTEVKNFKRKTPIIRGANTSTGLKAVERKKYLHVWRLDRNTTEEDLKEYIRPLLGNDSDVSIEKLKPKTERDYSSFKIGVGNMDYTKLSDPAVWPLNVELSEWIWFRRSSRSTQQQNQ